VLGRVLDPSYPADVRRHVTALTVARLTTNACYRFAPPFLVTIARGFDVSLADVGVALTVSEAVGFAAPLIGRAVDRVPRRTALLAGLAGVSAAAALAAASPQLWVLALALLLLSPAKLVFDVGLAAWVADRVEYERRGRVIGLVETSWALGLLVGVTAMGLVTAATSWRWGYVVGAVSVAVMALVVARRLDRGSATTPVGASRTAHDEALPLGRLRIPAPGWLLLLAMFAIMAASQCVFVTFGAWLGDRFGASAAAIAAVGFGIGAVELTASFTSVGRTDVWGKERSVLMGVSLMVPAGLLLVIGQSHLVPGLALLGVFLLGFEFAIVSALPMVTDLVPGAAGRGLGLGMGAGTLGRASMALVATWLYERSGFGATAALGAGFAAIAGVAMLLRLRALARPAMRQR
jgi:DHA1 family inner membrane transport protein